jgi:hypothetical protein
MPTVRRFADSGVQAVIVGMASLFALGVRVRGRSEWYTISASQQAPAATTLARWLSVGDADEVSACTNPKKIRLSAVSNATDVSLSVRPQCSVKPSSHQAHPRTTADALRAWLPTARIFTPELGVLPEKFRNVLMRSEVPRIALEIGARVEEMVTVQGGHVWRHAASLPAGHVDARRIDHITRTVLDEGIVDREGHFAADAAQCRYCGGWVCAHCADGAVPCDCCGIAICRRCVAEPYSNLWVCLACIAMRPPTRSEAREHGRFLSTRHMLIGTDALHVVVVERRKQHWTYRSEHGEKRVLANPSLSRFLDERLAVVTKVP